MDSNPPSEMIDLTCDSDRDSDNEECIKRIIDTIFTRICPIDLVSSDDEDRTNEDGAYK